MSISPQQLARRCDVASWAIAGVALFAMLQLRLLPALLAGLLVFELVEFLAPSLRLLRIRDHSARLVAVAALVVGIVAAVIVFGAGLAVFFRSQVGSVPALMQKMADVLDAWRTSLPDAIVNYLPADLDELRETLAAWLRDHAGSLQHAGTEVGRGVAQVLVGVGIGALVALHEIRGDDDRGPLARALETRIGRLGDAFRRVVFGQIRISALNTILTALYLLVALPLSGVHLPLAKTMVIVVFLVGLLPIIGNLISNSIIVILSLSVSPTVALISLLFLVVIHKLEYFLNAYIVGSQVHARAWELLLAMLLMESAFGVPGLIVAPIYYAYLKDELVSQGLV